MSDSEFYTNIAATLKQGGKLPIPPLNSSASTLGLNSTVSLSSTSVNTDTTTAPSTCNSSTASTALTIFGDIAGALDLGPIAQVAQITYQLACPSATATYDFATAFNKVYEQLQKMENQLAALGYQNDQISSMISNNDIQNEYNSNFVTQYQIIQATLDGYSNILNPINSQKTATSLTDYVQKYNKGIITYPSNVFTLLNGLKDQKAALNTLYNPSLFKQFNTDLTNLCANPSTIPGDVIAQRNQCNFFATTVATKAVATALMARTMLLDEESALATIKYTKISGGAKQDTSVTFINPYRAGAIESDINSYIDTVSNNLASTQNQVIIQPTRGLPQNLLDYLNNNYSALHCVGVDKTNSGVAVITEWHADNNISPYIVTACNDGSDGNTNVSANFYYPNETQSVINVLGVLVSNNQTSNTPLDTSNSIWMMRGNTSSFNTWSGTLNVNNSVGPMAPNLVVNSAPFSNSNSFSGINQTWSSNSLSDIQPLWQFINTITNPYQNYSSTTTNMDSNLITSWSDTSKNNYYLSQNSSDGTKYNFNVWVPTLVSNVAYGYEATNAFYSDIVNTIRYIPHGTGTPHVFALHQSFYSSTNHSDWGIYKDAVTTFYGSSDYAALACLTSDCKISNSGYGHNGFQTITFNDGTVIRLDGGGPGLDTYQGNLSLHDCTGLNCATGSDY